MKKFIIVIFIFLSTQYINANKLNYIIEIGSNYSHFYETDLEGFENYYDYNTENKLFPSASILIQFIDTYNLKCRFGTRYYRISFKHSSYNKKNPDLYYISNITDQYISLPLRFYSDIFPKYNLSVCLGYSLGFLTKSNIKYNYTLGRCKPNSECTEIDIAYREYNFDESDKKDNINHTICLGINKEFSLSNHNFYIQTLYQFGLNNTGEYYKYYNRKSRELYFSLGYII